ncbi:MAG TPA: glycosyltransferase [Bacteroidales bacterium]|nr:glycosyltransferase [Bacteroidales bacterium]
MKNPITINHLKQTETYNLADNYRPPLSRERGIRGGEVNQNTVSLNPFRLGMYLPSRPPSLPVVSTFEGGIPDMVDDGVTGFLAPQHDVGALAGKPEELIRNPGMHQQMGCSGREKFEKEFTLEKFENRLTVILTGVAGK